MVKIGGFPEKLTHIISYLQISPKR